MTLAEMLKSIEGAKRIEIEFSDTCRVVGAYDTWSVFTGARRRCDRICVVVENHLEDACAWARRYVSADNRAKQEMLQEAGHL